LQAHAEPGGILVGHETYSLVKDLIRAEEMPPLNAKGLAKSVRNYKVLGRVHGADEERAIREHEDGLTVLVDLQKVDRARALAVLEQIASRLKT
jgi:hypothetical protein